MLGVVNTGTLSSSKVEVPRRESTVLTRMRRVSMYGPSQVWGLEVGVDAQLARPPLASSAAVATRALVQASPSTRTSVFSCPVLRQRSSWRSTDTVTQPPTSIAISGDRPRALRTMPIS